MSPKVLEALRARPWPGNLRELRNAIEHASILARGGPIQVEHLPPKSSSTPPPPARGDLSDAVKAWASTAVDAPEADLYGRFLNEAEPPLLRAALDRCGGNKAAAAQLLGIDRATLRQKLRRHEMG